MQRVVIRGREECSLDSPPFIPEIEGTESRLIDEANIRREQLAQPFWRRRARLWRNRSRNPGEIGKSRNQSGIGAKSIALNKIRA